MAPTLASALGTPLAGTAVAMLASKFGIETKPEESQDDIAAKLVEKLETASPADLSNLVKLENEFKVEMSKIGLDEERIHQMDRSSARERQIKLKDKTPDRLAYSIITIFALTLAGLFWIALSEIQIQKETMTLINVALGILMAAFTGIVAYYFGSSKGSKAKTDILEQITG